MSTARENDYWREHAEIAADEAGIEGLSDEQYDAIAGVIESAHEFHGQSTGNDVASANRSAEIERDRQAGWIAAELERHKVHCEACYGPRITDSMCLKCGGSGRHSP